jgi:hypothetical protein
MIHNIPKISRRKNIQPLQLLPLTILNRMLHIPRNKYCAAPFHIIAYSVNRDDSPTLEDIVDLGLRVMMAAKVA